MNLLFSPMILLLLVLVIIGMGFHVLREYERAVIFRHALRNVLIPIVTVVGLSIGGLLGGAVITESIFGLPGVGRLAIEAIHNRDYPMIQGTVLLVATSFVFVNLIVDVIYAYIDPRIRY